MVCVWLPPQVAAQPLLAQQSEAGRRPSVSPSSPFGYPRESVADANPPSAASVSKPAVKRAPVAISKPAVKQSPAVEQTPAAKQSPAVFPSRALTSPSAKVPMPLAPTEGTGNPAAFKLQAGVTHSEVLMPLPEAQRPGRIFRGDAVSAGAQRMKRFKVPDWMAGIWQRSEAKEISRIELPSGRKLKPAGNQVARVKDVFGSFRDGNGQVWQMFNPQKASGQVDRGLSMDYHQVHSYDLVITGPKSVVVEVQATHTMVSKANHRIANVYQDEELNKYTLSPDGKLLTDSSVKVFDLNGKPFLLTRATSSEVRLPPKNWPPQIKSPAQRN